MNHLAHALLVQEVDSWIAGSMLADVRPRLSGLPTAMEQGVRLHRRIDALADQNQKFLSIRAALRPAAGLYAGVAADICCDNLLIDHWERFSELSLKEFTARVTRAMRAANPHLPAHLRTPENGPGFDWLAGYGSWVGLERAFRRVRGKVKRAQRFPDIAKVLDLYSEQKAGLAQDFVGLFEELSRRWRRSSARFTMRIRTGSSALCATRRGLGS